MWLAICLYVSLHIRTVGLAWLQKLAPQPVCEMLFRKSSTHEAPSVCSGSGGPDVAGSNQEAELSKSIAALQKDVAEAQQQAAQEAGHVAQYKSLAEGAEENTRIVQVSYTPLCTRGSTVVLYCCTCRQAMSVHIQQ